MKIVLLGDPGQVDEIKGLNAQAELVHSDDITAIEKFKPSICIDLLFDNTQERINKLSGHAETVIANSVLNTLNQLPAGFIRINGWNTFLKRPIIEAAGPADSKKIIEEIFLMMNKKVEWVADIAGFISARVVASVINEAYFALEEGVSTKEEIDIAMKLGTNYPYGPFEWSEKIGVKNIYQLLTLLSKNQKRYMPSGLLSKEANN